MYHPSLQEVEKLSGQGNLVPVYREINADLETPVSAYLKVARPPYSFLLESVEGGERTARYSFIGTDPQHVVRTGPGTELGEIDPLVPVQQLLAKYRMVQAPDQPRFNGGMVGYLSYDAVRYFESLPSPSADSLKVPESVFMLTTTFLIFDHVKYKIRVVSHAHINGDVRKAYNDATKRIDDIISRLSGPVKPPQNGRIAPNDTPAITHNMTRERYDEIVKKTKEYILAGDIIQAVLSQRLRRPTTAHPFNIYRALRAINPSPYMYYLQLDDFQIVGASPEMLVQVDRGTVATRPIAGTRPRGKTQEQDLQNEKDLLADEKERAEHIMLVDLGRNDVGRVCRPGTVKVTDLMVIERYSHVMHIVSHVTGKLRDECTAYDALRACFPAGTLSGAPKIRAMEIIAEFEPEKRGPYGGAVGYFDFTGNMDTAITIRTMVVKDGVAHVQAGGGIVFDSVPQTEYEETLHKASAQLRAIEQAERDAD
ncbi:MAG: anthranilate synthase component I [SAR202 cluster bacterium]|nr:anthranilate synthase component I [SAR202 cluster bacterium]